MEDRNRQPPPQPDVRFETTPDGYRVLFSERIANDHPGLVDECADWMEDVVGAVNLGQIDHATLLADGILSDRLRQDIVAWWTARVADLAQG